MHVFMWAYKCAFLWAQLCVCSLFINKGRLCVYVIIWGNMEGGAYARVNLMFCAYTRMRDWEFKPGGESDGRYWKHSLNGGSAWVLLLFVFFWFFIFCIFDFCCCFLSVAFLFPILFGYLSINLNKATQSPPPLPWCHIHSAKNKRLKFAYAERVVIVFIRWIRFE